MLSPALLIFLERMMTDAPEQHEGTISICGRTITNVRFEDNIDGLAGSEDEMANLVDRLAKTSSAYRMEINAERTKIMTNNKYQYRHQGQQPKTRDSSQFQIPGSHCIRSGIKTRSN